MGSVSGAFPQYVSVCVCVVRVLAEVIKADICVRKTLFFGGRDYGVRSRPRRPLGLTVIQILATFAPLSCRRPLIKNAKRAF